MLKFSNANLAFQYLANLTGSRILIAKSLEDLMPELVERFRKRVSISKNWEDHRVQQEIVEIARIDPKFDGNLKKSVKSIHILLEWYFDNPPYMSNVYRKEEIKDAIRKLNNLRGKGKTSKKLKDFQKGADLISFIEDTEEELANDKREQILKTPDLVLNGYHAYLIDGSWEEEGQPLFAHQTKWCVNEQDNYEGYKPLWLFTKPNRSYYALFSPSDEMFNNVTNDPIEADEIDELMPLIEKLDLERAFERSNAYENYRSNEPPYEQQRDYERDAWDSWAQDDYVKALENKFEDKVEDMQEGYDEELDIGDIGAKDLFELFEEVAEDNSLYWEWEQDYDGSWSIYINVERVANNTPWKDIQFLLGDDIERTIYHNTMLQKGTLGKLSKKRLKYLEKSYPKYFKELKEHYGQQVLFSSVDKAIQYLADLTGKRIKISTPTIDVSKAMQKIMERDVSAPSSQSFLEPSNPKAPKTSKLEASLKKLAELVEEAQNEDEFMHALDKLGTAYMHPIDINRKLFSGLAGKRKFYEMVKEGGIESVPVE